MIYKYIESKLDHQHYKYCGKTVYLRNYGITTKANYQMKIFHFQLNIIYTNVDDNILFLTVQYTIRRFN